MDLRRVITAGMAVGNVIGGALVAASGTGVAFLAAAGLALGGAALGPNKVTTATMSTAAPGN